MYVCMCVCMCVCVCVCFTNRRSQVGARRICFTDSIGSFGADAPRRGATARWLTENPEQGTFSQTYGRVLTVILHMNDLPCCCKTRARTTAGRSAAAESS